MNIEKAKFQIDCKFGCGRTYEFQPKLEDATVMEKSLYWDTKCPHCNKSHRLTLIDFRVS